MWQRRQCFTETCKDNLNKWKGKSTALCLRPHRLNIHNSNVNGALWGCAVWWPWTSHIPEWKDSVMWSYQFSLMKSFNILKISVFPKWICKFNKMPVKIQQDIWKLGKMILKFIKCKDSYECFEEIVNEETFTTRH